MKEQIASAVLHQQSQRIQQEQHGQQGRNSQHKQHGQHDQHGQRPEQCLVILGLGSNLPGDVGSSEGQLIRAVQRLEESHVGRILQRSQLHITPPWGGVEQGEFHNAVIAIETALQPLDFLHTCQGIERAAQRTREVHWGPRTLDIDLLAVYRQDLDGYMELDSQGQWVDELILPHPLAHQRGFVLVPWGQMPLSRDQRFNLRGHSVAYWLGKLEVSNPQEVQDIRAVANPQWDGEDYSHLGWKL